MTLHLRGTIIHLVWVFCRLTAKTSNNQFTPLSVGQGLLHYTIFCITQDHNGLVWFGTENGVDLCDGYQFKVCIYNAADSTTSIDYFVN